MDGNSEQLQVINLKQLPIIEERLRDVIAKTEIGHLLDSHPYDLSGGEQQPKSNSGPAPSWLWP